MRRPLLLTALMLVLLVGLLVTPASASEVSCATTGSNEFEVCFVHVEYDVPATNHSTWTYRVSNLQTVSQGAELSNWALELCLPSSNVSPTTSWTTIDVYNHPGELGVTTTGIAGSVYTVEVDLTKKLEPGYSFTGIKFDHDSGLQLGPGDTHIFQFQLQGNYAYTSQTLLGVGTKDGGGSDVDELDGIGGPSCPPTAVKLASFVAHSSGHGEVSLSWETAAEYDNAGFNLYRGRSLAGPFVKVNSALIAAKGSATSGAVYSFVDTSGYGTFYYRLEDIDYHGVSATHSPLEITMTSPFRRPFYRPMYPGLTTSGIY